MAVAARSGVITSFVADGCDGALEARGHLWLRVASRFNREAAHETWRRDSWAADAPGCAFFVLLRHGKFGVVVGLRGVSWVAHLIFYLTIWMILV